MRVIRKITPEEWHELNAVANFGNIVPRNSFVLMHKYTVVENWMKIYSSHLCVSFSARINFKTSIFISATRNIKEGGQLIDWGFGQLPDNELRCREAIINVNNVLVISCEEPNCRLGATFHKKFHDAIRLYEMNAWTVLRTDWMENVVRTIFIAFSNLLA